jgi:hypothetical protein
MGQKATIKRVGAAGVLWISVLFSIACRPVSAQIAYSSPEKAEKLTKKSIRDAKKYDVAYKETHYNTNTYTYQRGEAGRKINKGDNTLLYADKPEQSGLKKMFRKKK